MNEWEKAPRKEQTVGCRDGCGKEATLAYATQNGWVWLPIQGKWRCSECDKGLRRANEHGVGG